MNTVQFNGNHSEFFFKWKQQYTQLFNYENENENENNNNNPNYQIAQWNITTTIPISFWWNVKELVEYTEYFRRISKIIIVFIFFASLTIHWIKRNKKTNKIPHITIFMKTWWFKSVTSSFFFIRFLEILLTFSFIFYRWTVVILQKI